MAWLSGCKRSWLCNKTKRNDVEEVSTVFLERKNRLQLEFSSAAIIDVLKLCGERGCIASLNVSEKMNKSEKYNKTCGALEAFALMSETTGHCNLMRGKCSQDGNWGVVCVI